MVKLGENISWIHAVRRNITIKDLMKMDLDKFSKFTEKIYEIEGVEYQKTAQMALRESISVRKTLADMLILQNLDHVKPDKPQIDINESVCEVNTQLDQSLLDSVVKNVQESDTKINEEPCTEMYLQSKDPGLPDEPHSTSDDVCEANTPSDQTLLNSGFKNSQESDVKTNEEPCTEMDFWNKGLGFLDEPQSSRDELLEIFQGYTSAINSVGEANTQLNQSLLNPVNQEPWTDIEPGNYESPDQNEALKDLDDPDYFKGSEASCSRL